MFETNNKKFTEDYMYFNHCIMDLDNEIAKHKEKEQTDQMLIYLNLLISEKDALNTVVKSMRLRAEEFNKIDLDFN